MDERSLELNEQKSVCEDNTKSELFAVKTKIPHLSKFDTLLSKINRMISFVEKNKYVEGYYGSIGVKKDQIIRSLKTIHSYFQTLGEEIVKGIIFEGVAHTLIESIHNYLEMEKMHEQSNKNQAILILEFETKFSVCLQFFDSIKTQEPSIVNCNKEKYSEVWKKVSFEDVGSSKKIMSKYMFLKKMMIITTTAILMEEEVNVSLCKKICFGISYPRYMLDYGTARLKSFIFYKYPNINLAKQIWNIPQMGATKELVKVAFESIAVNEKIYIPCGETHSEQLPDIHSQSENSIQVRVLSHKELLWKTKTQSKSKIMCCCNEEEDLVNQKQIESIIIHMHGGGFIALSSRAMQTMTRRWANKLKIPIFSIDYRKPPTHPFPAAPNDCFTVYKFIVENINKYMNINPKNIYLAGDSAGGNLACSLTGNVIRNNLPIPKGIYVAYPALDLRIRFSPSRIHAVSDPLLWPSMLILCLHEYVGSDVENQNNPLASPIMFTEAYIGGDPEDKRFPLKWPKTYISVGEKDPLYDDSILLMQKLHEAGVQSKCRVYPDFSHGFLSTDFVISECNEALKHSVEDLKKLIGFEKSTNKPKVSMIKQ